MSDAYPRADNIKLWQTVDTTDPAFTKPGSKGGHHFTSISPIYQVKMATKIFGPYGSSWGIECGSENFSETQVGETILINYDAVMFYPNGKFPIHASERLAYKTNSANAYIKTDEDARKKVVTNALTKGLSMLGFSADIFMGLFDDQDYVSQVATEKAIDKAEDRDFEIKSKVDELVEYVQRNAAAIENAVSSSEAAGLHKASIRHLQRQQAITYLSDIAEKGVTKIARTYKTKKENLENDSTI